MVAITPRKVFLHAALLLGMLWLCFAVRAFGFFQPGIDCTLCHGSGELVTVRWEIDQEVVERRRCYNCEGARIRIVRAGDVDSLLSALIVGFWGFLLAGALVGTFWCLKVVNCRVCGGAGGLALEVTSPGEGVRMVEDACFACEGRGRLTMIDRWVLWTTDRAESTMSLGEVRAKWAARRRPRGRPAF